MLYITVVKEERKWGELSLCLDWHCVTFWTCIFYLFVGWKRKSINLG